MLKNFLKLFSGNAIAQAIQLLALLYLTTLYLPDDFGLLGKIQSFGYILSIVITLQLNQAIPLSRSDENASSITKAVFNITLINFLLSFLMLLVIPLEYWLGILLGLVLGFNTAINGFLIYKGNYTTISVIYVIRTLCIVSLQFLFKYVNLTNGLLYGSILGEIMSVTYLYTSVFKEIKFNLEINFAVLRTYVVEWKSFTLHGSIQELLSVAIYGLPTIFYAEKFSENISGQYSVAYKIIYAPATLISVSLCQVLYPKLKSVEGFQFLKNYIWFDRRILFLLLTILIILFNANVFNYAFLKGRWDIVFPILPWMFINATFFLFSTPFRLALRALKLNKQLLKIEFVTIIVMSAVFFFSSLDVLGFTIVLTSIQVIQNVMISYLYKNYEKQIVEFI